MAERATKRVKFDQPSRRPKNIPVTDPTIPSLVARIESQRPVHKPYTSSDTMEGKVLDKRIAEWETPNKADEASNDGTWDDDMMAWTDDDEFECDDEEDDGDDRDLEVDKEEDEFSGKAEGKCNDAELSLDLREFNNTKDAEATEITNGLKVNEEAQLPAAEENGLGEEVRRNVSDVRTINSPELNRPRQVDEGKVDLPPIVMNWSTNATESTTSAGNQITFFDWASNPTTEPDFHIQVFDQAFHVHSEVIKHYSEYFTLFLDSRDKEGLINKNDQFPYRWVSLVEDDGQWYLVMNHPDPKRKPVSHDNPPDTRLQIECFKTLLDIFYGKEVVFKSSSHLKAMVQMADFYLSLPILRHATSIALSESPDLLQDLAHNIQHEAADLLDLAVKLQERSLYHECFIYVVGDWKTPLPEVAGNVKDVFEQRKELHIKVKGVWKMIKSNSTGRGPVDRVFSRLAIDDLAVFSNCPLPKLFRKLYAIHKYETQITANLLKGMLELLENHLQLNARGMQAGIGECEDRFFCIDSTSVPWARD